jgi:hypothetical protein
MPRPPRAARRSIGITALLGAALLGPLTRGNTLFRYRDCGLTVRSGSGGPRMWLQAFGQFWWTCCYLCTTLQEPTTLPAQHSPSSTAIIG